MCHALSRGDDRELPVTSKLTVEGWTWGPGSERSLDGSFKALL